MLVSHKQKLTVDIINYLSDISNEIYYSFFTTIYRSSRPEVLRKKGALKNLAKFTGKHLRQSLFFNKVEGVRPATLLKKKPWHSCFPVNFVKFLRTSFL